MKCLITFIGLGVLAFNIFSIAPVQGGEVAPSCVTPSSGIVGWWPGEGNANDVIGGDNGTLEGGATFAPGMVGQGFRLDGTNAYVQIPDSDALKPTNVTVEAWVWLDPNVSPANEHIIFKQNSWSYLFEGYSLLKEHVDNGDGTFTDRFSFVVTSGGDQVITHSTTAVQRGVWYHVGGTYDGTTATLWVNGLAEASAYAGFALDYGTSPVFIGTTGVPGVYVNMLAGIIDEPAIYNRALSTNEIAAIYNAGSAGKCAPPSPTCVEPPAGLVGWWKGDGNPVDSVGGNNGVEQNNTYTNGEVGQAFDFNGDGQYVEIPQSASLNPSNQLTIEFWMKADPNNSMTSYQGLVASDFYFISLTSGHTFNVGVNFGVSTDNGSSFSEIADANNGGAVVSAGTWHHVAGVYDGAKLQLYIDGQPWGNSIACSGNISPMLADSFLGLGSEDGRTVCPSCVADRYFNGLLDEVSIYSRALTPSEIQSIYNAGSAGKCGGSFPPGISVQPVGQTTLEGSNVVLSVVASGTGPFNYQWTFKGTNVAGATSATLNLANLHPNQSGNYSVIISSAFGSITSSIVAVTVIAQDILVYNFSATEKITSVGQEPSFAYSGEMFFIPSGTNGTFIGWGKINGKKQFWVNPFSDYLLITIRGSTKQVYTMLGKAGQEIDADGYPHIWSYLHKGLNTSITIAKNRKLSFPALFATSETHVYPDSKTGNMVLSESVSAYNFMSSNTQAANNNGQTMADLVNTLTNSLVRQGYKQP